MLFDVKIVSAQTFSKVAANPAVSSIMTKIVDAIVIPVLEAFFLFTFLVFVWGLFGLFVKGGDATERKRASSHILWGTIGMFIMISAYGIIRLIGNTIPGVGDPFL